MRTISILLFFFLTTSPAFSENKKHTDADLNGFSGAVKSVSTEMTILISPYPHQPDGPAILYPVGCIVCDFDEDGDMTRLGQNLQTGFVGETSRYVRDETRDVTEQITKNEKGELIGKVLLGPFGKTEQDVYQQGVLQSTEKFRYDENGNVIESLTYDGHGAQTAHSLATYDENGHVTEQFDYGPKNKFQLHYTDIYSPETDVRTFTNFNEDGTVRLTFMAKGARVTSFWEQPSTKEEFGDTVCFDAGCEVHHPNGTISRILTTFTNAERRDPKRVELRNDTDQVDMAADYEYEIDGHENWTKRTVWIWTSETAERRLLEIDTRTLTYWK